MKTSLLILLATITLSAASQDKNIFGIYTEHKRTLLNGEDGSKYTIDTKPFQTNLQYDFSSDNHVLVYTGSKKSDQTYIVKGDTLIFSQQFGARTVLTKYIIIENKTELVLGEVKTGLDESYYLKKYYFKKGKALKEDYLNKNNVDVYTMVEEMPSYPGDTDSLKNFVASEVKKSNLTGNEKVFLKLLINPDGKITELDILNNPKLIYVEEAVKITRKLSSFNPGKQNGKGVYVYYNFPVKFLN